MSKLTAKRVEEILIDCLFREGEDQSAAIKVEGIINNFGFNPERIEKYRDEITEMLMELPDEFRQSGGGGMSFLNACVTREGNQWGEHHSMENLVCLGIAIKRAQWLLSREMWAAFPGGMPYFVFKDETPVPA